MTTFAVGDIHGAHLALVQVLERSNFNRELDTLIVLGDVVDSWHQTREVIDELLTIPNRICLFGNHDAWAETWFRSGFRERMWVSQGGQATIDSYRVENDDGEFGGWDIPESHKKYFRDCHHHYVDGKNRCFVHGGFQHGSPIEDQHWETLIWDRNLWNEAKRLPPGDKITRYDRVFIGHTSTVFEFGTLPVRGAEVWNLDTGAGWSGKLTIMDVDTEEYWQSDPVPDLYPDEEGRELR